MTLFEKIDQARFCASISMQDGIHTCCDLDQEQESSWLERTQDNNHFCVGCAFEVTVAEILESVGFTELIQVWYQ